MLDFKKKFNSAERELETLREQDSSTHTKERSQVEKLQKQIQGLKEKHETDLQEKDKEIAQAQKQIKKMKDAHEEALKKKEEEIKKKDAELKHASDKQATLKQKLKETVCEMYMAISCNPCLGVCTRKTKGCRESRWNWGIWRRTVDQEATNNQNCWTT